MNVFLVGQLENPKKEFNIGTPPTQYQDKQANINRGGYKKISTLHKRKYMYGQ